MRISIIGLAQSGKTTFFELLTQRGVAGSLSGKKGSQIATAFVPDSRLDRLSEVYRPKKTVRAAVEFLDTPGLSTDGQGKGFTGAALDEARRADSFCLLIRDFESDVVVHPMGSVDARRDLEFILGEFILSDLELLDKRAERLRKSVQLTKNNDEQRHLELVERCIGHLSEERPLRDVDEFSEADLKALACYQLLSLKPLLVVLNVSEERVGEIETVVEPLAADFPGLTFTGLCADIESELAQMEPEEAGEFMADLGIAEPAVDRILQAAYELLGLQVYFTVGPDECRAWLMPRNGTAYEAAGAIHSDFQRGFIRAIAMPYATFEANPSVETFKRQSEQRRKEDPIADGDLVEFRFSVSK